METYNVSEVLYLTNNTLVENNEQSDAALILGTTPPMKSGISDNIVGPSLGDVFIYILFGYVVFNIVDRYLHRGRRRDINSFLQEPIPVDKTVDELKAHLVTKTVVPCPNSAEILSIDNGIEISDSDDINRLNIEECASFSPTLPVDFLSLDFDENVRTCAICIEPFEINDTVSWSRYHKCDHVFHNECILPWLARHDECPYCRCNYIMPNLEESVIADDFICCMNHGLVKQNACRNSET